LKFGAYVGLIHKKYENFISFSYISNKKEFGGPDLTFLVSSIIDKHQYMHFFIQHYISLEC